MALDNISPIDGRYFEKTKGLRRYFSEFALIKKRVYVELMYLKELGKGDHLKLHEKFSHEDAKKVKSIESITNHDVKAVEYFIKENLPYDIREYVHFALTSEDINNLSYSLLIKEFIQEVYVKKLSSFLDKLEEMSLKHKNIAMLSRTHGQPASPTTVGKEFLVYHSRLRDQINKLNEINLKGKLNGATGNFSALSISFPEKDWITFSKTFIEKLGLSPNLYTTQIENRDSLVELFQIVRRINNILLDLDRDMWMYISFNYFKILKKDNEIGSSVMPHKINPIDFENSEGNIKIANSLLYSFEDMQISRMQRDLSDSTMTRNIGVAFSHSIISLDSTRSGLNKLDVNEEAIYRDLNNHPEVISEAIQTILRKYNKTGYEVLKDITRGKRLEKKDFEEFIEKLDIGKEDKELLKNLDAKDYIGLSTRLVEEYFNLKK